MRRGGVADSAQALSRAETFQIHRLFGTAGDGVLSPIVLVFPLYELVRQVGLVNQPWGLIIPYAALNLPFAVWLLTGYMERIPYELEEAAAVDGLTAWQTYSRIIMPLTAPALTTAFLLVFIFSWNEFMFALTFLNSYENWTVPLAIGSSRGQYLIDWGYLFAGSVLITIPIVIVFLLLQKYIVQGLVSGAVKG